MEHFLFSMIYGIILSNWLIFFRGVETTNQIIMCYNICSSISQKGDFVAWYTECRDSCIIFPKMAPMVPLSSQMTLNDLRWRFPIGYPWIPMDTLVALDTTERVMIRAHHEEKWTGKSHPTMEWWLVDVSRSNDSLKWHYLSFVNYFLERNMNYIYQNARNGGSWMTRSNTSSVLTVVYVSLCQDRTDGKPPARVLL